MPAGGRSSGLLWQQDDRLALVGVEQQVRSGLGAAVGQPAGSTRHGPAAVAHVDLPQRWIAHDRLLYKTMRLGLVVAGLVASLPCQRLGAGCRRAAAAGRASRGSG